MVAEVLGIVRLSLTPMRPTVRRRSADVYTFCLGELQLSNSPHTGPHRFVSASEAPFSNLFIPEAQFLFGSCSLLPHSAIKANRRWCTKPALNYGEKPVHHSATNRQHANMRIVANVLRHAGGEQRWPRPLVFFQSPALHPPSVWTRSCIPRWRMKALCLTGCAFGRHCV